MQHADPTADPTGLGALRTRRSELCGDEELTGGAWCSAWAAIVDEWLGGLYTDSRPQGLKASTALVAVGGYGRASLSPGSDLDLLLIHDGRARDVAKLADALWYPIWDSGISLDHSVRTIKELGTAMDSDVKVALGLLDMRLIAGDPTLAETARHKVVEAWRERSTRWLGDLHVVVKDRHDRFGDLAFLLEPDLKEARGGLRDVQLLRSLASVEPNLASTVADAAMARAEETLSAARVELQRNATTKSNVLLLQDQDRVAKARRTLDTHGRPDADALMARVAGSARTIAWASDDAWRRMTSPYLASKKRGQAVGLEPGIVVRDGEIGLLRAADPAIDPSLALRLAATSAEQDLPMARAALDRLAKRALPPDGTWTPATLQALLRLLGAGRPAIAAVEALDQRGVWLRYLPEWAAVRHRPQRNAYHRFTVDRHLLETVANAASRQSAVHRPDLLLLGALLHDIGKGRGGDHTALGIGIVESLSARMGLSDDDRSLLQALVRYHLLLPDVATRRDLDDPATAASVATAVGDQDTLELLSVLTESDSLATGPAAWGTWKAGLVSRLATQAAAVLEGRPPPEAGRAALSADEAALLANGDLRVMVDGSSLRVAAPDQRGLLGVVAGVLTLSGVNVRSATTISDETIGMALLRFEVAPAFDHLPDWQRFAKELSGALAGDADLERRLEEREARYRKFQVSVAARMPDVAVIFDNESSTSTIVEVRAPDRGPVLYKVARAIASSGVTITCALVSTLGAEAIDVFYVHDAKQGRVEDPALIELIEVAILDALQPPRM